MIMPYQGYEFTKTESIWLEILYVVTALYFPELGTATRFVIIEFCHLKLCKQFRTHAWYVIPLCMVIPSKL